MRRNSHKPVEASCQSSPIGPKPSTRRPRPEHARRADRPSPRLGIGESRCPRSPVPGAAGATLRPALE
eukprot:15249446-Alexandrium_andersonii.AAC.1